MITIKFDGVVKSPIYGVIVFSRTFDIRIKYAVTTAKHDALPMDLFQ